MKRSPLALIGLCRLHKRVAKRVKSFQVTVPQLACLNKRLRKPGNLHRQRRSLCIKAQCPPAQPAHFVLSRTSKFAESPSCNRKSRSKCSGRKRSQTLHCRRSLQTRRLWVETPASSQSQYMLIQYNQRQTQADRTNRRRPKTMFRTYSRHHQRTLRATTRKGTKANARPW